MHEPPAATAVRGREVCLAKAHSRSIDSGERGRAFGRGRGGKLEGPFFDRRKVEAPDALYAADHPAFGAAPFCPTGSRPSSGLGPCESALLWLPGFRLVEPTARRAARPSPRSRDGVSCILRSSSLLIFGTECNAVMAGGPRGRGKNRRRSVVEGVNTKGEHPRNPSPWRWKAARGHNGDDLQWVIVTRTVVAQSGKPAARQALAE